MSKHTCPVPGGSAASMRAASSARLAIKIAHACTLGSDVKILPNSCGDSPYRWRLHRSRQHKPYHEPVTFWIAISAASTSNLPTCRIAVCAIFCKFASCSARSLGGCPSRNKLNNSYHQNGQQSRIELDSMLSSAVIIITAASSMRSSRPSWPLKQKWSH